MNVDQETSKSELEHIRNIGISMGLNPDATDRVLKEMYNYPDKVVPPERLIEIFRQQYN